MITGFSSIFSSSRVCPTAWICSRRLGWVTSTTCSRTSAKLISSSVARNAATSAVGRRWMKPTVSVSRACRPLGGRSGGWWVEGGEELILHQHVGVERARRVLFPALV